MTAFIATLKNQNAVLYWFGLFCLISSVVCLVLTGVTTTQVVGINAFIKPAKFFISVGIFCWTIGWYMSLLSRRKRVLVYSWAVVVIMTFELVIVTGQATLGKLSHFNISSALDRVLFSLMGIGITVFTVWTAYIGFLFFRIKPVGIAPTYLWGIRLGILLFVIFAFEGFMMASRLRHTVGAPDGGPGLPVVNWSTRNGDLRVAHFFGMHSLQLLPLFGYYLARRTSQVILVAAIYFLLVMTLLFQALAGTPLLAGLMN
ncbi:hypothetical protein [Spirosoma luteum]|uniref:hypothetical protein n=1 Tax=Spirosoma luteum TaxID=431553 RepID=UPI0003770A6D|nr:hypothetical protein [Spirosoma luteum]